MSTLLGKIHLLESKSKKEVVDWCMNEGLIASMYECPKCQKCMKLVERKDSNDGYEWMCRVRSPLDMAHKVKRSIRKGTWFENSNLSIPTILRVTYLWVHEANPRLLRLEGPVKSAHALVDWQNFCREVCMEILSAEDNKIGGPNSIVEIDESKFGKRKYNRGRPVNGEWVFGGVERGTNKCFLQMVPDRTSQTLLDCIKNHILPETTIISDGWSSYKCLEDENFNHYTVNHQLHFVNPATGAHTNTIEGLWSLVKQKFKERRVRRTGDTYNSYFSEFLWRRTIKDLPEEEWFPSFLTSVKKIYRPMTRDTA